MYAQADSQNHMFTQCRHTSTDTGTHNQSTSLAYTHIHSTDWHTNVLSNSMGSKAPTGHQATKGTC